MKPRLKLAHPTEDQKRLAEFLGDSGQRRGWVMDIRLTGESIFYRPCGLWMRADIENPRQYMNEHWRL